MELKITELLTAKLQETLTVKNKETDVDFGFTLSKVSGEDLTRRLTGLVDEITIYGKKLSEHMDIKDLKGYKSLISQFINEVVTNSHKFTRENFLDRRGRHRVYGIVKLVDKNLDFLAQELLKSEKDHLKILEKIDEIRGLILDLVV